LGVDGQRLLTKLCRKPRRREPRRNAPRRRKP
jgi:hypothetical protein